MPIKIEFAGDQPEKREVKTYTGSVKDWPEGVYQSGGELAIKFYGGDAEVMYISDGTASKCKTLGSVYTRVSDNSTILAITFAGTMNYPDGKPDDVGEPEQLSDPTNLKVGDWIKWRTHYGDNTDHSGGQRKEVVKVTSVRGDRFGTLGGGDEWAMNALSYTVVPAPKDHQ